MSAVGRKRLVRNVIATASAVALVGAGWAGFSASSAPASPGSTGKLAKAVSKSSTHLKASGKGAARTMKTALPQGVPTKGNYGFLLALDTKSTQSAYNGAKGNGTAAAKSAASAQLARINTAEASVIAALPSGSHVLYRTHALAAAVAVNTDVRNYAALGAIRGVTQVYPIAPKTASNSYAVPFVGTANAWQNTGVTGQNTTIAIIDTGIDYTHANFGGPGTAAAYDTALANDDHAANSALFPSTKIMGGFDFAGDSYDADPTSDTYQPVPEPDTNPLDCNGHGSHVAGTAAGLGVTSAGATYSGAYGLTTPFSTMRIGPGMAPAAKLYAYKVFGCEGSSDVVGEAIDAAADPNGNGDLSDHVSVINMSLGSDYGSPQDGDSFLSNLASSIGISVVVASGNGGDYYDIGGSPGDAPRTIAVANSVDAQSIIDGLKVSAPAGIAGTKGAERSIAYDYSSQPDLSGTVVKLTEATNLDGCDPLNGPDAAAVNGKIAFLDWTDDDTVRRCGSVARSGNVAAAGAIGFIFGDDAETFSAGITGSTAIPGVLVIKSAADQIKANLGAGVTITGTIANGFTQTIAADNDTLNSSSSRGVRNAGDVKPDVTGVGTSVFSTAMGTGTEGISFSGTSMATPEVAGLAALVRSLHPTWNPEEVKADIMNTANHDLYTGQNHTGQIYAPNRIGAGRVDALQAVSNQVLAYVANDPGAVSVSFGPLAVTAPVNMTKTVTVANKSNNQVSYNIFYVARTSIPGVQYQLSAPSITVAAHSTGTFNVTLSIPNPAALTKTIDPTVAPEQAGNPREFLADASGVVGLVPTGGTPISLRVPVYSAPRPASTMTQAASVTESAGSFQTGTLGLTGHGVDQGNGAASVFSIVSGFELQATSGLAPSCTVTVTSGCVHFPDERSADLKYVGDTSNAPQLAALGDTDVANDGFVYFAITTQGPWHTAASQQEFDILIDVNGDNVPDFVAYNTRYQGQDVMVVNLVDLTTGKLVGVESINDRDGSLDTALFDSDTMVMPVSVQALGLTTHVRLYYGIASYSNEAADPVDSVGVNLNTGDLSQPLSIDPWRPGLAVYGSFDATTSLLLFEDQPGQSLTVRKDVRGYQVDKGLGGMMVHFHNGVGTKAQLFAVRSHPSISLKYSATSVKIGTTITGTVRLSGDAGFVPTGLVSLQALVGSTWTTVLSKTLTTANNGVWTFTQRPGRLVTYHFRAVYNGDANYLSAVSATVAVTGHR